MTTPNKIPPVVANATRSLGFLQPDQDFVKWVRGNNLIVTRDGKGRQLAHMLHGPVHPNQPVLIHRIQVEKPYQRKGHGRATIQTLIDRANAVRASELRVRCPADSQANYFFLAIGFQIADHRPDRPRQEPGFQTYTYPLLDGHQETVTPH